MLIERKVIKVKEKEKSNMETNKVIKLGNEVYLTDPCYNITTWCQELLKDVKSGNWIIDYKYNEYDDFERETILTLFHEENEKIFEEYDKKIESKELGVDSGTIGIFGKEYYEKYHFETSIDEVWYDNNICNTKSNYRNINITENKGVWIHTSYGDGCYVADLYIKDDKICGIKIEC